MSTTGAQRPTAGAALTAVNEVRVVGRLAAPAQERELPSGDVLITFRVVVDRPERRATPAGRRPVAVDTLDCVAWSAGARRAVSQYVAGDVVELTGSLRRRFWRGAAGPSSRCEVEVVKTRRLGRAPVPPREF